MATTLTTTKRLARARRERALLLDAIEALAGIACPWVPCTGPRFVREMRTCARCRVLNRAWRMGFRLGR